MAIEYDVVRGVVDVQPESVWNGTREQPDQKGVDEFTSAAEIYLKDGWALAGGVSVIYDSSLHRMFYQQAVYRES
jgi:hypothetical protein